jgi:hypothetical protein
MVEEMMTRRGRRATMIELRETGEPMPNVNITHRCAPLALHIIVWCQWIELHRHIIILCYINLLKPFNINVTRCSNYIA